MADVDFQAARVKMVDGQLRTTDVTGHGILSAFLTVPREMFVPASRRELAYLDDDIEIAPGRFLMEPSPLGKLIQLGNISEVDSVLIVGAGNGYSSAVIGQIAASVVALEENAELVSQAQALLRTAGSANIEVVKGDLSAGAAAKGPFTFILVEGSVPSVPQALFDSLADGGRLVAVIGSGRTAVANLYTKSGSIISAVRGFNVSVKPLPGFSSKPGFSF